MAPRPGPKQARGGGVALGVVGLGVLAFVTIVLLVGRPAYMKVYDDITHPLDSDRLIITTPVKIGGDAVKAGSSALGAVKIVVPAATDAGPHARALELAAKAVAAAAAAQAAAKEATDAAAAATAADAATKPHVVVAAAAVIPQVVPLLPVIKVVPAVVLPAVVVAKPAAVTAVAVAKPAAAADPDAVTALDEKYTPTKEMVAKIAQEGYLVVTWANWHYWDFVRSWVMHVKEVGITGYIVGAMDDKLLNELIKDKLNCFSMRSGLTHGDFGWGSPTFAKMGREKIRLVSLFLKLGVHVIISDVDVMWLRNPVPYFQKYPEADILTSSDHLASTVPDESLERWPHAASAANIGIMLFREKSLSFVDKWIELIHSDDKIWDQNAFNDLFRRGVQNAPNDPKNLFMAYDGTLKMGILPVSIFCSGHTYFVQHMADTLGLKVYAVHATFQFSGTPGKKHRLREMRIWDDLPEYYDHPVGFLSFAMDGIDELLKNAGPSTGQMDLPNVQGHFKLVNHQITRVRNALAISGLLGRSLVLPEMWAGQDRWWAPHAGRIPGSHTPLPARVPLDHFFDLEGGWTKQMPVEHFGPNTEFKEFSFLNNSRLPAAVLASKVTVEVCAAGTQGCSDGTSPALVETTQGLARMRVQAGLKSELLKVALQNAAQYKVVHFTTMADAFGGFTNAKDWEMLQNRLKLYGSIWCCINAHPGHVHYDMLWDVPGHTDKFGKKWPGIWQVATGP